MLHVYLDLYLNYSVLWFVLFIPFVVIYSYVIHPLNIGVDKNRSVMYVLSKKYLKK